MTEKLGPMLCRTILAMSVLLAFWGGWLPARAAADSSLVARYTFDEGSGSSAKDVTGNGNDGKIVNAKYVSLGSGKGFAMRFDTDKAYVDCGAGAHLDITGAFTIELWLYPETSPTKGEAGLVGKGFDSYLLSYTSNVWFYVTTGTGGRTNTTDVSGRANIGMWSHIVATFDGDNASIYCNGKLRNKGKSKSPKVNSSKKNLYLRYPVVWGDTVEPTFKCLMDEVRIYKRALSEEEVVRHFREEVKERADIPWFEAVQLDYRVLAATATLAVEADFSRMALRPAGLAGNVDWTYKAGFARTESMWADAVLRLELREPKRGKVVARHEQAQLSESGKALCMMNVKDLPRGEYELWAEIVHGGARIGVASSAKVKLSFDKPAWAAAYDDVKVLNNFVAELLAVSVRQTEAHKTYEFKNPRTGWILISSMATTQGTDKVSLSIDSPAGEDVVIVHTRERTETLEAMRQVPAGLHKLHVRCEGVARPATLIVRTIPSITPAELGYHQAPLVTAYGPYTWEFLKSINLLQNGNVILEREPKSENAGHLADWRRQGKKVLKYYNTTWLPKPVTTEAVVAEWTGPKGFQSPDYDGIMIDEWASSITAKEYSCFAEAIKRIAANPKFKNKVIYPYGGGRFGRERAKPAVKACMDAGYKLADSLYIAEQPTEKAAKEYLDDQLRRDMLLNDDAFPNEGYARHMIMNLGFLSGPPESSDVYPGVDYKVYLDMQMNLLANDPTFFGLYGFQWYHIGYVDEEILRWGAKLLRHYCIEGKTDRLTKDPYLLSHIANGDFHQGAAGWTVKGADKGSVSVRLAPGYGYLQGRFGGDGAGDTLLVTKRSPKAPNRIAQTIRGLTPGRTYSVTMFVVDYGNYRKGSSINQAHAATVRIDDVKLLPERSFRNVFGSGLCGHEYGPFDRTNQLYITYRRDVFLAQKATAQLIVSDWVGDNDPGGPVGQELGFNFIQVQPYLRE